MPSVPRRQAAHRAALNIQHQYSNKPFDPLPAHPCDTRTTAGRYEKDSAFKAGGYLYRSYKSSYPGAFLDQEEKERTHAPGSSRHANTNNRLLLEDEMQRVKSEIVMPIVSYPYHRYRLELDDKVLPRVGNPVSPRGVKREEGLGLPNDIGAGVNSNTGVAKRPLVRPSIDRRPQPTSQVSAPSTMFDSPLTSGDDDYPLTQLPSCHTATSTPLLQSPSSDTTKPDEAGQRWWTELFPSITSPATDPALELDWPVLQESEEEPFCKETTAVSKPSLPNTSGDDNYTGTPLGSGNVKTDKQDHGRSFKPRAEAFRRVDTSPAHAVTHRQTHKNGKKGSIKLRTKVKEIRIALEQLEQKLKSLEEIIR